MSTFPERNPSLSRCWRARQPVFISAKSFRRGCTEAIFIRTLLRFRFRHLFPPPTKFLNFTEAFSVRFVFQCSYTQFAVLSPPLIFAIRRIELYVFGA
jgi:hypothetical protein